MTFYFECYVVGEAKLKKNYIWNKVLKDGIQNYLKVFKMISQILFSPTAQKMKLSIKDFFSKCDQIRSFLWIWSDLLKKSFIENFIFLCSVHSWVFPADNYMFKVNARNSRTRYQLCLKLILKTPERRLVLEFLLLHLSR